MITKFTVWNGDYTKTYYLALVNGAQVPCWPNAGEMCSAGGSGRTWTPGSGIQVRTCTHEEFTSQAAKESAHASE